jgi:hypothetical protein
MVPNSLNTLSQHSNAVTSIAPYRIEGGMFAFDDPTTGLVREPFIGGANYWMDKWSGKSNSCTITFSAYPLPDYDVKLELKDTHLINGSNYDDQEGRNIWLCPALFKYFASAPKELYIKNIS